jgi:hypothetical protein
LTFACATRVSASARSNAVATTSRAATTFDVEHLPGEHLEFFHAVQVPRDGGALWDLPATEKADK